MKVVGYVRRSKERENGYSLAAQRDKIERWASYREHEVVALYEDDDVSGALRPEDRPGLAATLAQVERGWAEGIVVAKFDRLSRSVRDFADLLERSRRKGWALICLDPELDTTTAAGEAFAHMLAVFAQFERRLFVERMQAGRRAKAAQGGYVGGPAPYGWRWVASDGLQPVLQEQRVIEDIRRLRAEGSTWQAIASHLNEGRVPSKSGRRWHHVTVRRIARRA